MLLLETQLPRLREYFARTRVDVMQHLCIGFARLFALMNEIESMNLPRRHQMSVPILRTMMQLQCARFMLVVKGQLSCDVHQSRSAVQRAASTYIAAQEAVTLLARGGRAPPRGDWAAEPMLVRPGMALGAGAVEGRWKV